MKFITHLGDKGWIWIVISILLLIFPKTRKVGIMSACALMFSLIVNNMFLKNVIARTRPYDAIEGLRTIVRAQSDFSFPSGHTASSFVAATVIFRNMPKKFGGPILILAILISISRLYVGVHYPTDVIFGCASGVLLAVLAERRINRADFVKNNN